MSRRRSRSASPAHQHTNSNDPRDLERRIFVGNLPTTLMDKKDMEDLFRPYGKINALSMFRGYGFVQFERTEEAEAAKAGQNGHFYRGYKLDVNMAAERRQGKAHSQQSSPRRNPNGDGRDVPRTRSRSPMHGRESRDHRDSRDTREPGRESRGGHPREHEPRRESRGGHPRDHEPRRDMREHSRESRGGHPPRVHEPRDPNFDRYRGPDVREKEPRGDPAFRDEGYDRYYRVDEYHRKKEEPYADRYRDPWNGRRDPEEERPRVEDRRRNELYRQYYEELQRRYDSERPVDCSVIVVNKQQKEYAETVGRKVRDLGMVVDLIFLNTEVSLTQAVEDVGRVRTPFAIIITQQHEVHRSCTVNILCGTPQEHRNMPMEDAMVLVARNYDQFKVEHRDKEREEIATKAAKMADDVLMREHEREGHPISVQPAITMLSEGRYLTVEELDGLIEYLRNKKDGLVRNSSDPHAASHNAPPAAVEAPPPTQTLPSVPASTHTAHTVHTATTAHTAHKVLTPHTTHAAQLPHLPPALASSPAALSNHQQELQAKILSLFNSSPAPAQGYGAMGSLPSALTASSTMTKNPPQSTAQGPGMMGARPPLPSSAPSLYGFPPPNRMAIPQVSARPALSGAGINFNNPSVMKALDTLIQRGPSINHLVNPGNAPPPRPGQGMSQPPPMAHYARHY